MSSLREKAANGMIWTTVERLCTQLIGLVIGIVIARILAPEDFGVVGMTAIFMAVAQTLIDSGFGSALIQNKNRTEEDYTTCFYFNIGVGIVLYGVLFFCAPLIAEFYRTPVLTDVIRALGLVFVLNSLTISQTAMLTVGLKFKEMSIVTVVSQLVSGVVGIVMAVWGAGVWALVAQQIMGAGLRVVMISVVCRWVPMMRFSRAAFKRLFGFGSKILASGLINTIYNNIYTLVIGRVFTASEVGYYNRGNQFAQLPSTTLLSVVMKVAYPLMAEVQDEEERLRRAYKKFLRLTVYVVTPLLVGLIALGEPFIETLLGEKWLPCVPLMQIMCLGFIFDPLTHINLNILYVKGRTDLVLKLELIKKPIAFLILFGMVPFGLWWLCAGRALYGFIAYCFNCYYTQKFIRFGFWAQMWYNVPVFVEAGVMGLAAYGATLFFEDAWVKLLVGILVGVVVYLVLSIVTKDESLEDVKEVIFKKK